MTAAVDEWMKAGERKQRRWLLAGTIALVLAGLVIAIVAIAAESNAIPAADKRAIDAVEAQGFHKVMLGGADLLACAKNESSRHFSATNPDGKVVQGTVCCGITGIGKGCTLRWR